MPPRVLQPKMIRHTTMRAAILGTAILTGAAVASAQVLVGVGRLDKPVTPQTFAPIAPLPVASGPATPAPAASPPAPPPAAPPVPTTPVPTTPGSAPASDTVLRYLPGTLDGLRLTGEIGDLRWPVYLTPAQAAAPVRVRLGYLSAVSVLPDTSKLDVRVNDRSIGTDAIDAAQGLRTITFTVPSGLLQPGYNALSVTVQQRHRVDCSLAATYELWTRIEPSATGLELPASTGSIQDIADLPALLPDADGSMPIHVLLAGKTNPAHVQRLIRASQAVALKGRFLQPALTFTEFPANPYGLNLALGTRAALSQLPRFAGRIGSDGPLAVLLPGQGGSRPTLLITGTTEDEVDRAIASLDVTRSKIGSSAGLLAAANYPARKAGDNEALRLRAFGIESQDFTGRFFRKSINVELPADILASDYGRGTFDLAGGYAAGLSAGAQVRVDVNGRSSGIIKLPYADGDVFRHNQLFLPLGLMRPGFNRIDVYAETPRAEDATCAAGASKRLLFLDTSELRLPTFAHVQRLPELAATTGGALPFTQGRAHLVVPKPDRDTMAAALSFTTRAAVAAGRILPFTFSTRMSPDDDGSSLVVSPARALDPSLMTNVGLDQLAVEKAWMKTVAASDASAGGASRWWLTSNDGPAACRVPARRATLPQAARVAPIAVAAVTTPAAVAPTSETEDLVETWTAERRAGGWRDKLAAGVQRIGALPGAWFDAALRLLPSAGRAPGAGDGFTADSSLLLAEGVTGSGGNVTTILTAPDSATLRASVGCLFEPQVWSKVHGRLAALDASNGDVAATDATSFHYRASGDVSPRNFRLVLAGWFSLNPIAFVLLALLTAACLSGTTLWFVRGVGRRPE